MIWWYNYKGPARLLGLERALLLSFSKYSIIIQISNNLMIYRTFTTSWGWTSPSSTIHRTLSSLHRREALPTCLARSSSSHFEAKNLNEYCVILRPSQIFRFSTWTTSQCLGFGRWTVTSWRWIGRPSFLIIGRFISDHRLIHFWP